MGTPLHLSVSLDRNPPSPLFVSPSLQSDSRRWYSTSTSQFDDYGLCEEGKEPLGLPLISRRLEFTDSFVSPDPNPENWQPNNVADPSPKNRHGLSDTHNNNYLQALQSSGTFFASSTFEVQSV